MKKEIILKNQSDKFDILSSIWILSCNDENSIISYSGLKYRLNLDNEFNLEGLIRSRRELFRTIVPQSWINEWKIEMSQGKRIPMWIREHESKERKKIIDSLSSTDFFRCQFRTLKGAEKAPIEIIDWGLKHIDRLRKIEVEKNEAKIKKWTHMWIPIASMVVALVAVLSSVYIQDETIKTQIELKKYEISFGPKQQNYSILMSNLIYAFESAQAKNFNELRKRLDKIEQSYYNIEPFLDNSLRVIIWEQIQQFSGMCYEYVDIPFKERTDSLNNEKIDLYLKNKNFFKEKLFPALFDIDNAVHLNEN